MGNIFYFDWEISLIIYIQSLLNSFGIFMMSLFSELAEEVVVVFIILLFYFGYDKKIGKRMALNILFVSLFNSMIKNIFVRRRPYFDNDKIECLKKVEEDGMLYDIKSQGYSFPSGHSANIASLSTTIYLYFKKRIVLLFSIIISLLVGISRFSLGVHYPSDVIVGLFIGLIIVLLLDFLEKRIDNKILDIILILISLLGFFYCKSNDYYSACGLFIGFTLGTKYEEKYINFEKTSKISKIIVRMFLAIILFISLNYILKLPFSNHLISDNIWSFLLRMLRYCIISFIISGIYPKIFKYLDKYL